VHSCVPHKEFRFVLPSFELLLVYAAQPAAWAWARVRCVKREAAVPRPAGSSRKKHSDGAVASALGGGCHDARASARSQSASRDPETHAAGRQAISRAMQRRVGMIRDVSGADAASEPIATRTAFKHAMAPLRFGSSETQHTALALLVLLLLALQLPMLLYFALVHQRGTVAAAEWLSQTSTDLPQVRPGTVISAPFCMCLLGTLCRRRSCPVACRVCR
jgi:hypothetical protein